MLKLLLTRKQKRDLKTINEAKEASKPSSGKEIDSFSEKIKNSTEEKLSHNPYENQIRLFYEKNLKEDKDLDPVHNLNKFLLEHPEFLPDSTDYPEKDN